MDNNHETFGQIAITLAKHFDSMYYVDIKTGQYSEYVSLKIFEDIGMPKQGDDFFKDAAENAHKCVYPDDIELVNMIYNKDGMIERLAQSPTYSYMYRLIINGKITHMRHVCIMCEDKKHVLCCLEDIEQEHLEKEEQERNLRSAERMARLDELTGIHNKNSFKEYSESVNQRINSGQEDYHFAVVMCDINDLKQINDTRGHFFGDEAIQMASRMICDIYEHSPVFRIGGDEFVVVLSDRDYENRAILLDKLREESIINGYSRSGPVVACGMAEYKPGTDKEFDAVFNRADRNMYENKKDVKAKRSRGVFNVKGSDELITADRKRMLDGLFGALYTVAGGGYVFVNDMRYDYSRWSLPLVDDFNMRSEYMYHAGDIWQERIHPDDLKIYREALDAAFSEDATIMPIYYRACRADGSYTVCATRAFILNDGNGNPEYFGGIIIEQ